MLFQLTWITTWITRSLSSTIILRQLL